MALDVSFGNMTPEEADRLAWATTKPEEISDEFPHEPGSTEPWVSRLIADFAIASGAKSILETGGFKGATSVFLMDALDRLSNGGHLHVCEIDNDRHAAIVGRLCCLPVMARVLFSVSKVDVLKFLATTVERFDLAFVDDNHEKSHVTKELTLLYPKMNPGGLILLHDVFGLCDLNTVVRQFGGFSIDLPRMGPAGGLGIIQV